MEEPCVRNEVGCSSHGPRVLSSTQPSSHHSLPPTKKHKHEHQSWLQVRHRFLPTRHLFILIILTCFLSFSSAAIYIEEEMVERSPDDINEVELLGSTFARLARSGTILVDQSPPPAPKNWELDLDLDRDLDTSATSDDLRRRNTNANSNSNSTPTTISTSTIKNTSSSTLAPTTTSSGIAAATTDTATSLPTPFDTGFNNNITSSCQAFMTSMLSNSTFKSCLPFSLLLQNSNSFFQASKSLVRITQTLDYSCSANLTTCTNLMTSLAANLTKSTSCASDLSSQNPTITQAHLGLLAYRPLYTASCLRDPSTSAYCFANAITNASNPTDSYIYFLPLNVSLVGGSQPTCSRCLKDTMAVFEAGTADRSSALASDYGAAAMQVNVNCGPGFVNQSLAAAVVSGSPMMMTPPSIMMMGGSGLASCMWVLLMVLGSWLFV